MTDKRAAAASQGKVGAMELRDFLFEVTEWSTVEPSSPAAGVTARAWQQGSMRVRLLDYAPGFVSDHFCEKGHLAFCLSGAVELELRDGRTLTVRAGQSFQAPDGAAEAHRARSPEGARLFIVD